MEQLAGEPHGPPRRAPTRDAGSPPADLVLEPAAAAAPLAGDLLLELGHRDNRRRRAACADMVLETTAAAPPPAGDLTLNSLEIRAAPSRWLRKIAARPAPAARTSRTSCARLPPRCGNVLRDACDIEA